MGFPYETSLATIGVVFTPMIAGLIQPQSGFIMGTVIKFAIIVVITMITNMVRAYRYCEREKDGKIKSYGFSYGIKKGMLCGGIAIGASIIIGFIPILRIPFTIISFIPGLGSVVDGIILALFHLISYLAIAYPIWGSC
jgi:hypothetical protein